MKKMKRGRAKAAPGGHLSGERSVVANVDADVGVPAPVSEEACVPEMPVSS